MVLGAAFGVVTASLIRRTFEMAKPLRLIGQVANIAALVFMATGNPVASALSGIPSRPSRTGAKRLVRPRPTTEG